MPNIFANPIDSRLPGGLPGSPDAYNTIVVASTSFGPFGDVKGKFELQNSDGRKYKWDIKDAPGTQGATISYRGWRPSGFTAAFYFWEREQIDGFFDRILPLFWINADKTAPIPVTVLQVQLAALDVHAVVAEDISPLVYEGSGGLWSTKIKILEYRPASKKNATTTPTSTISKGKPGQQTTPNVSAFEQGRLDVRDGLLAQAKKLTAK